MEAFLVQVEDSTPAAGDKQPSAGPVYRCVYAKDGLLDLPPGLKSPWDLFCKSAKRFPQHRMLGHRQVIDKKASSYVWQTYEQVHGKAVKVGCAMRSQGLNPGDRCGIYGSNCPEWLIAMEACNCQGICYVPLYDSLGSDAIEFILNHAEVTIAFVQENKISSTLDCLPKCSFLKTIVSFGAINDNEKKEAEKLGVSCFAWEDFMLQCLGSWLREKNYDIYHEVQDAYKHLKRSTRFRIPHEISRWPFFLYSYAGVKVLDQNYEVTPKSKDDICTIMYTSGTTGEPKGVVLTNKVVVAQVLNTEYLLSETDTVLNEEDSYLSYLPLAHVFDQIIENYCIYKGASIGFWQGDVRNLMEDIQELKPTLFCGVPRVYDRIYTGINQKIQSGGIIARALFEYAYQHKLKNLKRGYKQDQASPFFDKLVFSKIKQGLGGRIRLMLSGAAPVPNHVEEFLRVTSCSVFLQGYGLTESCAGCFTSIANVFPMMGTVGVPYPTIEARLESVPEMDCDALSEPTPRGEICLRGTTLFSGYHRRPDLTDEAIINGWFHTGDIGEWQDSGAMKIVDRKKNIFKLSQGEYVAIERIESVYSQCHLVSSIWVYGNSFESYLVAVAIPERKPLEEWAAINQVSDSNGFEGLCKHNEARKYVLSELNHTAHKKQLRGFEMLKAVHLDPKPFDMERDLITPTFKLKRVQLLKYYQNQVDELYAEAKESNKLS